MRFPYQLSIASGPATAGADWWYVPPGIPPGGLAGKTCKFWVYIPTTNAGGLNAHYHIYSMDNYYNQRWLFWTPVNQETSSGWVYLGQTAIPSPYDYYVRVHLDNIEAASPGWDVAFDAVAFHCFTPF